MPQPQVRIAGAGFTTLLYGGLPIAWLQSFQDQGQQPLNQPETIYELAPGLRRAKEIVTPHVLAPGSLTASIKETWNARIWETVGRAGRVGDLRGAHDLLDIWDAFRQARDTLTCTTVVRGPTGAVIRGKVYHNVVVNNVDDGESIQIGTLSVDRNISMMYTHSTPLT